MTAAAGRDYRLDGAANRRAMEAGLADGEWFRPRIDGDVLRELMARSNRRATADTTLWFGALLCLGGAAVATWVSWWTVPILVAYGALYGGAADPRWHECGHGTAFASDAANTIVYHVASFMLLREPTVWRWSHHRHHTDTIVVGRDAEIAFPRPRSRRQLASTFLHLAGASKLLGRILRHASGRIDPEVADYVPARLHRRVVVEARAFVTILVGAAAIAVVTTSPLPVLLVGLPSVYGAWLLVFFGITQHAGLREDVLDHRLNTRTVYMNPLFRFLYSNMNYHVEHHLFPAVPYHALPALHAAIGDQLAPPCRSTLAAYTELLGAIARQRDDIEWELEDRVVPETGGSGRARVAPGPIITQPGAGGWTDLGPADMSAGTVRRVQVGRRPYAVVCLDHADGAEVCVIAATCTHGRADLSEGLVVGGSIECPRHNGRFDLRTGAPVRAPASEPVAVFATRTVDGRIEARVDGAGHEGGT